MLRALIAAAAIFWGETAAFACSCSPPESATEKRDIARRIATKAVAIVEVEPVSAADIKRQIGETYRIVKVEYGNAQTGLIRMARTFGMDGNGEGWMSATSCDVFPGYRKRVLLIPTGFAPRDGGKVVPAYTLPGEGCGQVLPVRDASADLITRGFVPVFSFGGSCEDYFFSDPGMIDLIREEARKMGLPLGS